MMLSSAAIAKAKANAPRRSDALHEHDDCIRIAYEWLDAQTKTKGVLKSGFALKHIIENWAQRYISTSDVIVAAYLHPEIRGEYPYFNLSSKLTVPNKRRLVGIAEAGKHDNYGSRYQESYKRVEE